MPVFPWEHFWIVSSLPWSVATLSHPNTIGICLLTVSCSLFQEPLQFLLYTWIKIQNRTYIKCVAPEQTFVSLPLNVKKGEFETHIHQLVYRCLKVFSIARLLTIFKWEWEFVNKLLANVWLDNITLDPLSLLCQIGSIIGFDCNISS